LLSRLETSSGSIEAAPAVLLTELQRLSEDSSAASEPPASLRLIGRRDARSNNSWMHNAPRLVKGKLRHQLLMHPQDLAERRIESGSRVRIRSRVGEIETEVIASDEMMPGVACLPHGFGHDRSGIRMQRASEVAGASYNDLSDPQALDGACGNAALNGLLIQVESV
jgi:anaerobic selenocysteine-containing dehydrogenase